MIIRADDVQKLCAQCVFPGYNCPPRIVQNIEPSTACRNIGQFQSPSGLVSIARSPWLLLQPLIQKSNSYKPDGQQFLVSMCQSLRSQGRLAAGAHCRSDKIKEASSWPLRASIVHACARAVHHFFPNPITGFPFFIRTSRTLVCSELIRTLGTILLDGFKPATTGRTRV